MFSDDPQKIRQLIEEFVTYDDISNIAKRKIADELMAIIIKLQWKINDYIHIREYDFELVRSLAADVGIEIKSSNKSPGAQWMEFRDGVEQLKIALTAQQAGPAREAP